MGHRWGQEKGKWNLLLKDGVDGSKIEAGDLIFVPSLDVPGTTQAFVTAGEAGLTGAELTNPFFDPDFVIQDFQDPYTLDVRKLRKCCVAEIVPDGRLIPFCAYNSVGYREQVRGELA